MLSGTDAWTLCIMAKAPRPGKCKTRLCPPLTYDQAAALYQAFVLDTVRLAQNALATVPVVPHVTLVHPEGDSAILRRLVGPQVGLQTQLGSHLGTALHGAFERAAAAGATRIVILSTDSPNLPLSIIHEAYAALDDHDLVLGPSHDGGYYLIGLTRPQPHLFEHITWSTPVVYAQTCERAAEAQLRRYALPRWYDVDTFDDLTLLVRHLDRDSATYALLSAPSFLKGALLV